MVFSADCLEHLKPEDVDKSLSELHRVSRRYIAMTIGLKRDKCITGRSWFIETKLPEGRLHLSVFNEEEWKRRVDKLGANILSFETSKQKSKHLLIVLEKR